MPTVYTEEQAKELELRYKDITDGGKEVHSLLLERNPSPNPGPNPNPSPTPSTSANPSFNPGPNPKPITL